jgi:hypothetical protein
VKYAAVLLAVALAGCSAIQQRAALDSQELLSQAGFRREPLNEAEREWIMSRGPAYAAAADRTAWSAWKPEGLDLVPAAVAGR